jgi:hypothetical protein
MARLSKEQRKEYGEELEYHYENAPVNIPSKAQPTTYERIKGVAGSVAGAGRAVAGAVGDFGQNPHVRQIASQSGFTSQSPRQQPRRSQPQYPDENPSNDRIYLTICDSQGHCRQKTIKNGPAKPRQPRRPGWAAGTLGGDDPGFR